MTLPESGNLLSGYFCWCHSCQGPPQA